ncbi:hypothetical protein AB837_00393 [bacterium AB1]|nr:hypothetical protein AB837_00393 [bacterium AB1]
MLSTLEKYKAIAKQLSNYGIADIFFLLGMFHVRYAIVEQKENVVTIEINNDISKAFNIVVEWKLFNVEISKKKYLSISLKDKDQDLLDYRKKFLKNYIETSFNKEISECYKDLNVKNKKKLSDEQLSSLKTMQKNKEKEIQLFNSEVIKKYFT